MAAAHFILALLCAPLLPAIIDLVSAVFQGKPVRPFFAGYRELLALAQTATAYPEPVSPLSRSAAVVSLGCMASALSLMPVGGVPSLLAFTGDFVLVVFCLILARMVGLLAGEEGGPVYRNGANGSGCAALLAEPLLLLVFLPLGLVAGSYSLGGILTAARGCTWQADWPVLLPVAMALLCLALAERQTAPKGDVDVLETSGGKGADEVSTLPSGALDRALREYGQALKLWFLAAVLGGLFPPALKDPEQAFAAGLGGLFAAAISMGILEGCLARLPRFARAGSAGRGIYCLAGAAVFAGAACVGALIA